MENFVDLRSDTVTRPGPEMLKAMFCAPLGDDVFGEDPTVNELESKSAALFGKEAGLFCPSGTMANQIAIKAHTRPGDEVICEAGSHIFLYESGGLAVNSGVQAKLIQGEDGIITGEQIREAVNAPLDWLCRSSLISIENTGNKAGGNFYTLPELQSLKAVAASLQLPIHLDGARIFNACVEGNYSAKETGACFDTLSVCFSKGLGAPAGSVLLGSVEFIKEARRIRKRMGGGMRQIGLLAAAGIYALNHQVDRLKEDHEKAKEIAQVLSEQSYVAAIKPVKTNIVIFQLAGLNTAGFLEKLEKKGVKAVAFGPDLIRMVTHLDVSESDLEKTLQALKNIN